ncbi:hypothetical protein HY041_00290 [Candidatus Roizmanbacteria bacterium]|nr:hypothetical protein [Candidatus Roizmanbacteria bacterium]
MLNPNFVIIGVIAQFFGGLSYLIDTIKGKIRPNRVSWFLWGLAAFIAFTEELKQGVGIQSLTTFMVGFVPLCVFIASFFNKKSEWKLETFDFLCGILSILGLLFWYITKIGNIVIFFSILADTFATLPTIMKSYHHPETENDLPYSMGIVNGGIALLTLQIWNFQYYGYPLYLVIANSIIVLFVRFKLGKILSKKI